MSLKSHKRIAVYSVNKNDNNGKPTSYILTIVLTKKEAMEYINRLTYLDKKTHFELWATIRDLKPEFPSKAWNEYVKIALNNKFKYSYIKWVYDYNGLLSLLRIASGFTPIGCSFETSVETETYLINKAYEEKLKQEELEKEINEDELWYDDKIPRA